MTDRKNTDPAEGSRDTIDKELRRQEGSDKRRPDQEKKPGDPSADNEP